LVEVVEILPEIVPVSFCANAIFFLENSNVGGPVFEIEGKSEVVVLFPLQTVHGLRSRHRKGKHLPQVLDYLFIGQIRRDLVILKSEGWLTPGATQYVAKTPCQTGNAKDEQAASGEQAQVHVDSPN
jgi:hypothetical protein